MEPLDAWRILKGAGVERVKFIVVDICGNARGLSLSIDEARQVFREGVTFDGSSVPKYSEVHESDVTAQPDPSAVYVEPGIRSAWVFCQVVDPPKAALRDPRLFLIKISDMLEKKGIVAKVGIEVEFFLVKVENGRIVPADEGGYFDVSQPSMEVAEHIERVAREAGLGGSKVHHEGAPGQYEYNLPPLDPVRASDSFLFFKHIASTTAARHGLKATFMPKPFWGVNGSGAHIHLNLTREGESLFNGRDITREGMHLLAGLLGCSKAAAAVAAPTVNSYKRLIPHHEAPTRLAWGYSNRSTLIRVPNYCGLSNRIELREPDPLMNPYLTLAMLLTAAVKGLEGKAEPPEPVAVPAYDITGVEETPLNLLEALHAFENTFRDLNVPGELASAYLEVKKREWREYIEANGSWEETWNKITPWEYERYL